MKKMLMVAMLLSTSFVVEANWTDWLSGSSSKTKNTGGDETYTTVGQTAAEKKIATRLQRLYEQKKVDYGVVMAFNKLYALTTQERKKIEEYINGLEVQDKDNVITKKLRSNFYRYLLSLQDDR